MVKAYSISTNRIAQCPFFIFAAEHYTDDGTGCECHTFKGRERMKRDWEYTDEDFIGISLDKGEDD